MPPAGAKKKESGTYYAWTDFYTGGDVETRKSANGVERRLVSNRTHIVVGDEVSKSSLGVDDAGWEALIEGGSVRDVPVPDDVDDFTSPHRAILRTIVDENGDIDVNKLLALGAPSVAALTTLPPPTNPSADSEDIRTLEPAGA